MNPYRRNQNYSGTIKIKLNGSLDIRLHGIQKLHTLLKLNSPFPDYFYPKLSASWDPYPKRRYIRMHHNTNQQLFILQNLIRLALCTMRGCYIRIPSELRATDLVKRTGEITGFWTHVTGKSWNDKFIRVRQIFTKADQKIIIHVIRTEIAPKFGIYPDLINVIVSHVFGSN